MYKENVYFRNKITFLNIVLTFMIVVLHAKSPERFGLLVEDYPLINAISMLCRVATPLFFFVSSLLFFKGCTFDELERKYKSRIHSLLIPYILWNIIFVAIFFILAHVPVFASQMNLGSILNSPKEIIMAILNSYHTDLWFVKNLMFYSLLAPVFLILFRNKRLSFFFLILLLAIAVLLEPEYKSMLRWAPIYQMGAMCGYYCNDQFVGPLLYGEHSKTFTCVAIIIFIGTYLLSLWKNSDIYIIYTSPLLIWFIVDGTLYKVIENLKKKQWMNYMFFIFCTHHFILNVLQKIIVLLCSPTQLVIHLTYILSPIVTILLLLKTADLIYEYNIYKVLCGRR